MSMQDFSNALEEISGSLADSYLTLTEARNKIIAIDKGEVIVEAPVGDEITDRWLPTGLLPKSLNVAQAETVGAISIGSGVILLGIALVLFLVKSK